MGELGGFLRIERVGPSKRDPRERVHDYRQYFSFPDEQTLRDQGGRCMDCGIPFCHEGCPLGNLIPDWNDLVYRGRWREALLQAPLHQQLPRVHRPDLPGAVRVGLRARHQRRPGDDRADRGRHRRARLRRGLGGARAAGFADRPHGCRGGLGPGRPGGGRRAEQVRPHGHRVRARRGGRAACCASACPTRSSRSGSSTGGSRCSRPRGSPSSAGWTWGATWIPPRCAAARRGGGGDRLPRPARPRGARARAARRALRDGLPLPAQPRGGSLRGAPRARHATRAADQRRGQARARRRRRRHRDGLHLERAARGRDRRADAGRVPAADGRRPPAGNALAAAAQAHADDLRARGGRRAPVRGRGHGDRRRGRPRGGGASPPRGGHLLARPARDSRTATGPSPPTSC